MPSYSSPPATLPPPPQSGHDSEGDSEHPSSPDKFLSVSKITPTHTQPLYTRRVRPTSYGISIQCRHMFCLYCSAYCSLFYPLSIPPPPPPSTIGEEGLEMLTESGTLCVLNA
jgi:hypothetical protein